MSIRRAFLPLPDKFPLSEVEVDGLMADEVELMEQYRRIGARLEDIRATLFMSGEARLAQQEAGR